MAEGLTEQEQRFLEQIAAVPVSLKSRIIPWALEILPGTAFFLYGLLADRLVWEVFGFFSVVYFAAWRMFRQLKGHRLLQSIHAKALVVTKDASDG